MVCNLYCLTVVELASFLKCATGTQYHKGNVVYVEFVQSEPAFTFHTCGNLITISTSIESEQNFMMGLVSVIRGDEFTMA